MHRWLAIAVLLALPGLAAAQAERESRAHMEACVRWTAVDGHYLTLNSCDTAISILFMTLHDGKILEQDVMPGSQFESGPIDSAKPTDMMFTVCPIGYRPNVPFTAEHFETISVSLYNCLPQGKPGV
jgi:hypothetical protein